MSGTDDTFFGPVAMAGLHRSASGTPRPATPLLGGGHQRGIRIVQAGIDPAATDTTESGSAYGPSSASMMASNRSWARSNDGAISSADNTCALA